VRLPFRHTGQFEFADVTFAKVFGGRKQTIHAAPHNAQNDDPAALMRWQINCRHINDPVRQMVLFNGL
jgi:hypothetical protein